MDSEDEEFDVFKAKKWRGNRKSSFAQVFHARERDQQGVKVPSKTAGDQRVVRKSQITVESQNKGGINPLALMEFKKAFDANHHGELNKVNFIKTCKGIHDMASEMSEGEMESFFMKIDVNNKGVVDWDDFTTFILLQQLAKENEPGSETATYVKMKNTGKKGSLNEDVSDSDLSEDEDIPVHPRPILKNYKVVNTTLERPGNIIERIIFLNHIQTYVTATQDGMLNLWHADSLKLLRSQRNGSGAWITDIVAMAQQPLAVFAMDQSLTFYDTGRLSFDVLGCIEDLKSGPLCATWLRTPECDKLLYGDDRGYLHMFDFSDEWGGENPRVAPGVSQDMLPGMSEKVPWRIHTSWITKIKYLAHSSSLLSCSMDSTLLMLDLDKEKKKWSAKEHSHGIYTLDYCRNYNFIVTCGLERYIKIWNPFTAKTMGSLHGHQSPIVDVVINEDDNQIISVATDHVIKIWDVRSNRCMQTIIEKPADKTTDPPILCRLLYDKRRGVLLAGGSIFESWHKRLASETRSCKTCSTLYSCAFRQVVIAEVDSLVLVWNVDNGEHVFSFSDSHRGTKISAMSLDVSGRRLLVGSQDGSLRMWNFNNGQCLKEFLGFGKEEITCVACLEEGRSRFVAAAGWHGKVCIWPDGPKETEIVERSMKGHSDDISCMTLCAPNSIATGGYDGKVIVWKLDGTVRCKFLLPLSKDGKPKAMNHLLQLPQDRILVGSVSDGEIYFWRVFDARTIYVLTSGHHDEPGPACTDANNEILFSSDARGYIKAWDLSVCNFKSEDCSISNLSEMLHFRAHHERIVAMEFMEKERILLTTSLFGTCRLWTDKGTRIGQFGQLEAWDLRAPQTWSSRRPSYISPSSQEEGATPDSSRVSSSTGTSRSSSSRGSRLSLVEKITIPEAVETKEKTDTEKSIEEKAASILEAGAPNFRLESWFAPLQAAYHRQLPIKKIVPWGPIFPANFEHVEKPPPESVTDKSVSVRAGRKKKHMDPMRLSLPNIQFNMPKEKLATLSGRKSVRSLRSTTRSVSTARSISTSKSR